MSPPFPPGFFGGFAQLFLPIFEVLLPACETKLIMRMRLPLGFWREAAMIESSERLLFLSSFLFPGGGNFIANLKRLWLCIVFLRLCWLALSQWMILFIRVPISVALHTSKANEKFNYSVSNLSLLQPYENCSWLFTLAFFFALRIGLVTSTLAKLQHFDNVHQSSKTVSGYCHHQRQFSDIDGYCHCWFDLYRFGAACFDDDNTCNNPWRFFSGLSHLVTVLHLFHTYPLVYLDH